LSHGDDQLNIDHERTAFETSSKITLASYGLTDVIPLEEYMREHNELKDIAFRKVLPMQGALELVVHLVSR
jgi:hypothetical protein